MLAISCILGLFTSELKGERLPDGARRRHRSESASDTVKVMPAGFQQLGGEVRRQKEKKNVFMRCLFIHLSVCDLSICDS